MVRSPRWVPAGQPPADVWRTDDYVRRLDGAGSVSTEARAGS
ncbi:hypothetical protein GCM10017559_61250 [Streptosporangium longisporum]|uniref:Uncharacterized protein n=1 Tax=Streptosporangium longisporum TaxID=46187 RepID=A0ABP6L1G0_9ACTN